jgi:thiol-disulfide isomerase/thioredoxin
MKRIAFSFTLVMLFSTFSLSAQKTTLSGTIKGLPEGYHVVISQVIGDRFKPVDTLQLDKKNAFKVTLDISEPTLFLLHIDNGDGNMCHLMVEPKDRIQADFEYIAASRVYKISNCKGSDNVVLYAQFNDILAGATDQIAMAKVPEQVEDLIRKNKDKLMASFLVTFFEQDFENHATLYQEVRDALTPKYAEVVYVKHLAERLKGVLVAGMEAPEIVMDDPNGVTRRLSDLRGKVVLIDFWASWCGPCRRENPNVVKLYKMYHDKGFEIFSVSLDKDGNAWRKAIQSDGLVWPNHVSDLKQWQSAAGRLYGINSIPATVLVDAEGKIIARNLRGSDLERKLKEIFE